MVPRTRATGERLRHAASPQRGRRRLPSLPSAAALALLAAGCSGPLSALDPAGPAGAAVAQLWWIMLAGAALLFALVAVLLWMAWRPSSPLGRISERGWLVLGGLGLPALVLTPLGAYGFIVGERAFANRGQADLVVEAVGQRWHWTFAYPQDAPSITAAPSTLHELHVPAGRTVEVRVSSRDVIHSFWTPRLAGKIDGIPGHVNRIRISADRPGVYHGVCAEFCGAGHAEMRFTVVAHEPGQYPAALAEAVARQGRAEAAAQAGGKPGGQP